MTTAKTDSKVSGEAFVLEGWTVEPLRNLIIRDKVARRIEPKTMGVLVCLAERAGRVVSRRAITDQVWATEFISDSTLTHAVADLRKALGDDPRAPRFVETIPKNGYRLIPKVEGLNPPVDAGETARPMAVIAGERVQASGSVSAGPCEHVLCIADREIPLSKSPVVFGRDHSADVQILAPEVSRHHARLEILVDRVRIEDLGSKNGTRVNNRTIDGRHGLESGDVVEVGATSMTYCHRSDEPTRTQDGH